MEGAPADDSRGFWGLRIPAGREIALRDQLDSSEYVFTAHFTQVALGSDPRSGKHTVYLRNRRGKFAIGTLEDRCCTQFSIDLFDESINDLFFSHTGSSSVYITGYKAITSLVDNSEELGSDMESEKAVPPGVPLHAVQPVSRYAQGAAQGKREQYHAVDQGAGRPYWQPPPPAVRPPVTALIPDMQQAAKRSRVLLEQPLALAQFNRVNTTSTPTPEPELPAMRSTHNKHELQYMEELKQHLLDGPMKLSSLGTLVKRPIGQVSKLSKFLADNKDVFNVEGDFVRLANS